MNKTDFETLLLGEMAWAIEQKRKLSIQDENGFRLRMKIVGPGDQIVDLPVALHSMTHKVQVMAALSVACKRIYANAVVVTSDCRYVLADKFCAHFSLTPPTAMTFEVERFNEERYRVMKAYGGEYARLPRHLWAEELLIFAYGPRVSLACRTRYRIEGEDFAFDPPELMTESEVTVKMIPAWWD
jgi:hypothetical protein